MLHSVSLPHGGRVSVSALDAQAVGCAESALAATDTSAVAIPGRDKGSLWPVGDSDTNTAAFATNRRRIPLATRPWPQSGPQASTSREASTQHTLVASSSDLDAGKLSAGTAGGVDEDLLSGLSLGDPRGRDGIEPPIPEWDLESETDLDEGEEVSSTLPAQSRPCDLTESTRRMAAQAG